MSEKSQNYKIHRERERKPTLKRQKIQDSEMIQILELAEILK